MSDRVIVEERGTVRVLRIARPEQRNCVDGDTAAALGAAIEAFAADRAARVLVVTGDERAFCAGADLKRGATLFDHPYLDRAGPMGFARLDPGKPTIAAIEGYCFAGGGELAAWCDFRIAGQGAEFGCLSRRWGVPYTDGGTQRFPRIMGEGNALYFLLTGVRIDARRAFELGLVQEVVERGGALSRALELADAIAAYPNFAGLCADRAAVRAGVHLPLDEALLLEAELVRPTVAHRDGDGRLRVNEEVVAHLLRFAAGERDPSPRPPEPGT